MANDIFGKYGITINTTPSPEALAGIQGRRTLNALKDLGSWLSEEVEESKREKLEKEMIKKLQEYGQQLQSLDPNSPEYQKVFGEMLLTAKDVKGYIDYMKQAAAAPDLLSQYEYIMKALDYANNLGAFQAVTGQDMFQLAQPLLQTTFNGNYGQTTEQIPNIAGGLTGQGTSEVTRPITDEELWSGIVSSQKEQVDLEKYKQQLGIQNEELGIIKLKAEIDEKINQQEKDKVDEAIKYMNNLLDIALSTNIPEVAEDVLSIDRIPVDMQQTLKKIGLLPEGSTTIIPAAEAIVANAANKQDIDTLSLKLKIDQNKRAWEEHFLNREKFEYEKAKGATAGEGASEKALELTVHDKNFIEYALFGDKPSGFDVIMANFLTGKSFSLEDLNTSVQDGYITRLEKGEFKTPEEMWHAYKRDLEPFARLVMGDHVANKLAQTMAEMLQNKGYIVPKELTQYVATAGSMPTITQLAEQNPMYLEIIERIKTVSPEEAKQAWAQERAAAVMAWNKQGENGEELARLVDKFLSTY